MYRKDPCPEDVTRQTLVLKQPASGHAGQRPDQGPRVSYDAVPQHMAEQAGRALEQPPYRYDSSGCPDQLPQSLAPRLRYEERVPAYEDRVPAYEDRVPAFEDRVPTYEERWVYHDDRQPPLPRPAFESQPPRDLDTRQHPDEPSERGYFPRFEEPAPLSYDSRPRYDQPPRTSTLRHEEPPAPGYDLQHRYRAEAQPYSSVGPRVPEPKQYYDQYVHSYEQVSAQARGPAAGPPEPPHAAAVVPPLVAVSQQKPEGLPASPKPLPPPPAVTEEEEDPAMKPQSVLTRVRMFENKRSASLESKKDENHTAGFKVSMRPCLSLRGAWHSERFAPRHALEARRVVVCSRGIVV